MFELMLASNIPAQIDPIAFRIGNLTVRWYAIILTSAMLIALFVLYKLAKTKKFTGDFVLEVFLWTIPLSIIAARLGFSVPRAIKAALGLAAPGYETDHWLGWQGFLNVFNISEGGLTILTGIFGGLLGIFIACKHKKVALFDVVDLVIPALLIGQALGRWGNFMNEELFGLPITNPALQWMPFAVYIHADNGLLIELGLQEGWYAANFFYESMMNLFFAIFIIMLIKRGKNKPGEISALYMFWYGLLRGLLEFLKLGAFKLGGVIGGAQIFSFCFSAVGLVLFILIKKGVIKLQTTNEMRIKKHIQFVPNDAFIEGTFNEDFDKAEKLEQAEEKEWRDRKNQK